MEPLIPAKSSGSENIRTAKRLFAISYINPSPIVSGLFTVFSLKNQNKNPRGKLTRHS